MNKLYNTYEEISNNLYSYFSKFTLSKTFLNFFPQLLISIIKAESSTFSKIALAASKIFPSILLDSITKRIHRFFNNSNYNLKNLYSNVIYDVLSRLTLSHGGTDNLHVSFDHTYIKDKYTILMFTLRIGKQGIPLYFEIFPGKDDEKHGDAFKTKTIKDGITFCHNLLSEFFPNAKIIFLADRWFGNLFPLMNYINELGDIYVFRLKENCKVFFYDKNEGHKIWVSLNDIPHYVHKSNIIENLEFTKKKYVANLVFCKSKGHKEPWKLITNGNPKQAKAFYGYRFGSIESVFKLTKTNGFYIEETGIKNFHAMKNFYSTICITHLYLTCLGSDISKNSNCYKNIGFRITRKNTKTNNIIRVVSRVRAGIILFKLAINSKIYYRLPCTFTLYDT